MSWSQIEVRENLDFGAKFLLLMTENSWRKRRIETIQMDTSSVLSRRVTLDVDSAEIVALTGWSEASGDVQMRIPLTLLPKALFLDFDLRDESGKAIPLDTSDVDSKLSTWALLSILEQSGVRIDDITERIFDTVFKIVRRLPSRADESLLKQEPILDKDGFPIFDWQLVGSNLSDPTVAASDEMKWAGWLRDNPRFVRLLRTMSLSFCPTLEIPIDSKTHIIKYRYTDTARRTKETFRQWLGSRRVFHADLYAVRTAARTHTRIVAPDGLIVAGVQLLTNNKSEIRDPEPYHYRILPQRAVIYTSALSEGEHTLYYSFRPSPTGLLRQVRYILLAMAVTALLGSIAHFTSSGLTNYSLVLALLLPGYLLALLWRQGESDVAGESLRRPRFWVSISLASQVAAAAAIVWLSKGAIGVGIAWLFAASVSTASFVILTRMSNRSKWLVRDAFASKWSTLDFV